MAQKGSSAKTKEKYKAQYQRTEANKKRKVAKHAHRHPNDKQAEAMVAKLS